jgi:hypothetical protein
MLDKKRISRILRYAGHDLPLLENKIRGLRCEIIELEFRKKDLIYTLTLQNAQLLDLGQAIMNFHGAIDSKSRVTR